ncbi:hypothetical protein B7494_g2432 [Chlorociboria aeruginascens]|nr:hypothetical protein B7494_g2432 [Chlorociboria aeruginascens]
MAPQTTREIDTDSLEAKFQRISLSGLGDGPHRDILNRAIRNVLSTDISEITLAQIVDGLPLSEKHKQLCPGVLEKMCQLYSDFDIDSLRISSKLLHEYRISAPGSRTFHMRLIELAAVATHQIAVQLYELCTSLYKDDCIAGWEPPRDHPIFWIYNPDGAPPTLFQHRQYRYYDQYPDGIADGVGYWAESRIFGGVVLFDRREPGSVDGVDVRDAPLPGTRILTPGAYSAPRSSPLPILGDQNNRRRVDPEEPVETTGIYRDLWERKPLGKDQLDQRLKDVIDRIDFPTVEDLEQAQQRAAIRRERFRRERLQQLEE